MQVRIYYEAVYRTYCRRKEGLANNSAIFLILYILRTESNPACARLSGIRILKCVAGRRGPKSYTHPLIRAKFLMRVEIVQSGDFMSCAANILPTI